MCRISAVEGKRRASVNHEEHESCGFTQAKSFLMRQRYLWYKVSHIPATILLCRRLYVCSLQVWYYEVLCFVFPISLCNFLFVLSYSYLPFSVISSPFLPFFTVNSLFSFSSLYSVIFSPLVRSLHCPPYLSLLRLLFLLNPLLLLSFAVFSVQSSFIFPYLPAAFSSSSNSTSFCSSFLAGLRVDELQSVFE